MVSRDVVDGDTDSTNVVLVGDMLLLLLLLVSLDDDGDDDCVVAML